MKPYDRSLLDIFAAEQAEHIVRLRAIAGALGSVGSDALPPVMEEALRRAHTLKGAARAVGLNSTESIAHGVETLFSRSLVGSVPPDPGVSEVIHHALDAMEDVLAAALADRPEPEASVILGELDRVLDALPSRPALPNQPPSEAPPPPAPAPATTEFVRVNAASIDDLIRASSQLVSAAAAESESDRRAEEYLRRVEDSAAEYLRLRRACARFLRRHEDDTEFGTLRECLEFAGSRFAALVAEARSAAVAQHQRNRELRQRTAEVHQNAVLVRMIPAESVFGPFGSMVRELAHDSGKEVEFRVEGLDVQADRMVLQALKDPVMHLLRNAVSHGIEPPDERLAAGKPAAGTIRLGIDSGGGQIYVTVEDDGRGLDLNSVRAEAVRRGLISEADPAARAPDELAKLIFHPGFSTSKAVTNLSGRGIGLSVVERTVSQLQGDLAVRPRDQSGLQITISVALSISTLHVLLVTAGGHTFGVPARFVERLLRTRVSDLQTVEGREVLVLDSRPVRVVRLLDLLNVPASAPTVEEPEVRMMSVMLLASGGDAAGIVVDRFVDDREAIVKDLGLPPELAGMTAGGVPLEDGTVAVVLNAAALLERAREASAALAFRGRTEITAKPAWRILVVDDSVTTRSLEKSILEAHGYDVRVAVDGLEALEKLSAEPVDLVITDVAMPRMDGLQLLEHMKKHKETERIPVIIVTSLERREDQQRGLSLGADAYIVKRKFDQRELLNTVRQIL